MRSIRLTAVVLTLAFASAARDRASCKDIWPGGDLIHHAPDGGIARSAWTVASSPMLLPSERLVSS